MISIKINIPLKILILGLAAGSVGGCKSTDRTAQTPPNILFIMSDDHSANAISCYSERFRQIAPTPRIDGLASEGALLTRCFATNSICAPSRATILTGKYSNMNGVYTLKDGLDPEQQNLAGLLNTAGYQTAIIGKWHLKTEPSGFDYYSVLPGQGDYFDPVFLEKGNTWVDGSREGTVYQGYVTDIIADKSMDWLEKRDKSRPFFLMMHNKAPHGLWEYSPEFEHMLDSALIPEPASLVENKAHRSEGSRTFGRDMLDMAGRMSSETKPWPTGYLDTANMSQEQMIRAAYHKYISDYLRVVASVDKNVGRVLDYLKENGLAENTIVIYTSDQGLFLGEHSYYDKRWMFDESIRMPFIIRYPVEIKAGTVCSDMITNVDFAELLLDYAGVAVPEDMQGRSFRKNLLGKTPPDWRTSFYYRYWMHIRDSDVPAHYGIRTDKFKLIHFYGRSLGMNGATENWITPDTWELYDLENDPNELKNLYELSEYQGIIDGLKNELEKLKKEVGDLK